MEKKESNKRDGANSPESGLHSNRDQQAVDKAPGEERGRGEKLSLMS
jgi:hypothetical protein